MGTLTALDLPKDAVEQIFRQLSITERILATSVCRKWRDFGRDFEWEDVEFRLAGSWKSIVSLKIWIKAHSKAKPTALCFGYKGKSPSEHFRQPRNAQLPQLLATLLATLPENGSALRRLSIACLDCFILDRVLTLLPELQWLETYGGQCFVDLTSLEPQAMLRHLTIRSRSATFGRSLQLQHLNTLTLDSVNVCTSLPQLPPSLTHICFNSVFLGTSGTVGVNAVSLWTTMEPIWKLKGLQHLEVCNMYASSTQEMWPPQLSNLTNLTHLSFAYTSLAASLEDDIRPCMERLRMLHTLDLTNCRIPAMSSVLPQSLRVLKYAGNSTESFYTAIPNDNLEELEVNNTIFHDGNSFCSLLRRLRRITVEGAPAGRTLSLGDVAFLLQYFKMCPDSLRYVRFGRNALKCGMDNYVFREIVDLARSRPDLHFECDLSFG